MSDGPTSRWLTVALAWRGTTLLLCLTGLLTNGWGLPFLSTQTNLLVLAYLAGACYWMVRRRTANAPAPVMRGVVTVAIVFVGLMSHWVYAGGVNPFQGLGDPDPEVALVNWSAFLIHYVVPALMLIDWVAFGPHRVVGWPRALLWAGYPIVFAVVTVVRSLAFPAVWARYPVEFLDPAVAGWGGVILAVVPLIGLVLVLAGLLWCLDWLAGRRGTVPNESHEAR